MSGQRGTCLLIVVETPAKGLPVSVNTPKSYSTCRGRDRHGRRRGSRYQRSEDEASAASSPAEELVDDTLAPLEDMASDALPSREGGDGDASLKERLPPGDGLSAVRGSRSPLGRPTGTMTRGRSPNRSSHPPRPCHPSSGVPTPRPSGSGCPPTRATSLTSWSG